MEGFGRLIDKVGRGATEPGQREEWSQLVGSIPRDRFSQMVTDAMRQVDAGQYQAHLDSSSAGTRSIAKLARDQQAGLAQTLLDELAKIGQSADRVSRESAVAPLDPQQMSSQALIKLLLWIQSNHPEVLGSVAARYQDEPDILVHFLGGQTLLMVVDNLKDRQAPQAGSSL